MRTRLISAIAGAMIALGPVAAMATPAAAETVQQNGFGIVKGQTAVTVDAGAAVAFDFFNIQLSALRPATGTAPAFTFPVFAAPDGTAVLLGGVKFTANDKCFLVYSPVVDPRHNVVKALVSTGKLVDLFTVDGDKLVLTAAGAAELNTGLGFDGLFSAGFVFGTFATTLQA